MDARRLESSGWDVKPRILIECLEAGAKRAAWLDADLIVLRDPTAAISSVPAGVLTATEEYSYSQAPHGSRVRLQSLGLQPGRDLDVTINSCVVSVTRDHWQLLASWSEQLSSVDYKEAQKLPFDRRPNALAGDQDVLTALLGSAAFSDISVELLRSGTDVIHCMDNIGYLVRHRLRNLLCDSTIFCHAQGRKPWEDKPPLSLQLSPYAWAAAGYKHDIGPELEWTRPRSIAARGLNAFTLGNPHLRGLIPAAVRQAQTVFSASRTDRSHV